MVKWQGKTAVALGAEIAAGALDPLDLCESVLSAIQASPLSDRIYARVTTERALSEAEAAKLRAKRGQRLGPLDGVPASWKDLFDSAGDGTEAGTALLQGRVPLKDAKVLARAGAQGLVCLGKTHMSELAFSGLGLNPVTATPPCLNDADAVSGGSSSGAAASVAFGLAPAAIGSDTGGSVRIPSAWNDLVGFKPTHGALPLDGVVPLCSHFDTVGPLTRSVEDAAALFSTMGGPPRIDLDRTSLAGARLLVLENVAFEDIEDTPLIAFEGAVERLQAKGAIVERGAVDDVEHAMATWPQLFAPEAYAIWGDTIEANPDVMFPQIRERFRGGRDVKATEYLSAWRTVNCARLGYHEQTARYDAVIVPTAPIMPPNVHRLLSDQDYYVRANLLALRNTRIGNLLGLCAVTLPTGVPSAGIMFFGGAGSDARLLRLAKAAEAALG